MDIQALTINNEKMSKSIDDLTIIKNNSQKIQKVNDQQKNLNGQMKDKNHIITKTEREFFVQMFPENSEQIERHVIFNRNGKVQSHNVKKGVIVDGLA
jgi:hypothetical protein